MENLGPHAEGLTFSELHAQLSVPCWHRGLQATWCPSLVSYIKNLTIIS